VKNANDCRLLYISMIYDINFAPSLEWILASGILPKITADDESFQEICEYVTAWIEHKLELSNV